MNKRRLPKDNVPVDANDHENWSEYVSGRTYKLTLMEIDHLRQENEALRKDVERLCVMVIKWVERNHHDWDEACNIANRIEEMKDD